MSPKIYRSEYSPPNRSVMMTVKALGINVEYVNLDLSKDEHKTPEYLAINPQHTIPTLVDDDLIVCESHAIMAYLVGKYGKDDSLYPKDLAKRALVDQRLHFDSGVIFALLLREIGRPLMQGKTKTIPEDKIEAMHESYGFLEQFLHNKSWMAGDNLTIADISLVATVTSAGVLMAIDPSKYPNLTGWLKRIEKLHWYSENVSGLKKFYNQAIDLLS